MITINGCRKLSKNKPLIPQLTACHNLGAYLIYVHLTPGENSKTTVKSKRQIEANSASIHGNWQLIGTG